MPRLEWQLATVRGVTMSVSPTIERVLSTERGGAQGVWLEVLTMDEASFSFQEEDDVRQRPMEASMEQLMVTQTAQPLSNIASESICAHGRIIDDVLTKQGKRTGQVRCLECGSIFEDPYQGLR